MIVRRIAAVSAAAALLGGLAIAGPAVAAKKQTELKLNKGLVTQLEAAGIAVKAVKPAQLNTALVVFPISGVSGKKVTHVGGLKFKNGPKFVKIENIVLNTKTGYANATISSNDIITPFRIKNMLIVTVGNKAAKSWKNATMSLARSADIFSNGDFADPAPLINSMLVDDPAQVAVKKGQRIGKVNSTWK